jgi:hypothetical protein
MTEEIQTVYFRVGTIIQKSSVWSLNAEARTRSVGKDELDVAVELNSPLLIIIALDMEFCEIK